MGTDKRERQKANRAERRQQQEKAERANAIRQRITLFAVLGFFVVAAVLLYRFRPEPGSDNALDETPTLNQDAVSTTVPAEPITTLPPIVIPQAGGSIDGQTECPAEDGSSERITSFSEAPPMCIDPTKTYTAVMVTAKGDITVELDASKAPSTVNNFVVLARYHFYDGVAFHRIIPGFVVQGGDAVGPTPGIGNPGYQIEDELPEPGEYQIGSLAMANSGPDTSGSQFFVVTGDQGASLPPLYSLFGTVTEGLDVVTAIESTGTPGGSPSETTIIESVTVTEN